MKIGKIFFYVKKINKLKNSSFRSTENFDYFVMNNNEKDNFEKNSQVFFCYGRISNR